VRFEDLSNSAGGDQVTIESIRYGDKIGKKTGMELPDQFSDKEKAVIDLLLQGKSNKQISLSLGVT